MKIDYVGMYKAFLDLQNPANDLEVLEEVSNNLDALQDLAQTAEFDRFSYVVDDTTMVYMTKMVSSAQKIVTVFTPLCDDFLGISKDARAKASLAFPEFLISYGIILYKRYGYEIIADYHMVNNTIDPSKMSLPTELLDDVTADLTQVIDTLRTILTVFKTFGAYFAEYQIAESEDLNDVIASLEDRGYGTDAISTLSQEEVERILTQNNGTPK